MCPSEKAAHTNPGNAFTTRLRLVRLCGPFLAALREIWMRHSTRERNHTLVWFCNDTLVSVLPPMSASAGPASETNLGSISFGGVVGMQNENVAPPGHHLVRPEPALVS